MFEKTVKPNKTSYVSCIKINGVPILPPVISSERRKELLKYKQQAVKLEQRLRNCLVLKKNLQELLNTEPLSDRPTSDLTFRDNNHIEALGISETPRANKTIKPVDKWHDKLSLSKDIVDVTEYSNDGIKIIYNYSENDEVKTVSSNSFNTDTSLNKSTEVQSISDWTDNEVFKIPIEIENLTKLNENTSANRTQDKSPRPRLIRSNSYTLETPSPILLAHLEKTRQNNISPSLSTGRNWNSLEDNYVPFEQSQFSSINTVYNTEKSNTDDFNASTPRKSIKKAKEVKSPTIEVFQTDISVQQITVNTNETVKDSSASPNKTETFYANDAFDLCDPDSRLMQVLQKMPEDYSNQIIELIQKQKTEQEERLERYDKIQKQNIENQQCPTTDRAEKYIDVQSFQQQETNDIRNKTDDIYFIKSPQKTDRMRRSSTFSMSPSESIYYSISNNLDSVTAPHTPLKLIDLENMDEKANSEKLSRSNSFAIEKESVNVSRKLFPQIDAATMEIIRREWAACVIGAHVKGYLTRRLLKTEKVQSLINTIKDALMCALQLHSSENIDEADVELHRRLIQQVSAACYAFHDIFFSLSPPEQMQVISLDRQLKIEKAKRPASATSSRTSLNSSRLSTRHRSASLSKSSTKV